MTKGRLLTLVGMVMYVVAWFLPAVKQTGDGFVQMYGWGAFVAALVASWSEPWRVHLIGSVLTNVVAVVALTQALVQRRRLHLLLRGALIASAVLNTHWFVFGESGRHLRIGYYVWVVSFFVIATGLAVEARHLDRQRPGSS